MPARPPRRPAAPPRERILAAAKALFAERGFSGTGIEAIARRAGVNKALLYYHVGNKREIYNEVLGGIFAAAGARVEAAVAPPGGAKERLLRVQEALAGLLRETPEFAPMMLREVAGGGGNLSPEVLRAMAGVFGGTRKLVEEGRRSGELRELDPVLTHILIGGSLAFLTAARPLRGRIAAVDPSFRAAGRSAAPDVVSFLHEVLWGGIAERRRPGVRG